MGLAPLSALVHAFGSMTSPQVAARSNGAWDEAGAPFGQEVLGLAVALQNYGLNPGSKAAVLAPEGCRTLRAEMAVIVAGGTLVPLDIRLPDKALLRVMSEAGVAHAIASDEKQLARILAWRPELPALEMVLLSSAAPSERKPAALLVDSAIAVGAAGLAADPGMLIRQISEEPGGTACLLGNGNGELVAVPLTALLRLSEMLARSLGLEPGRSVLSCLRLGSIERLAVAVAALNRHANLLLADPAERPDAGLRERPADAILLDGSGLSRLHHAWLEDVAAMSWLGRTATRWSLRHGLDQEKQGFKSRLADTIALRRLREKLGGKTRTLDVMDASQAGAARDVDTFFAAAGITIRYHGADGATILAR